MKTQIHPERAQLAQHAFRHVVVNLREGDNIATFAQEHVDGWALVQGRSELRVKRGDAVTLVSDDGLTLYDQAMVLKAEGGNVWLSKPLRIVTLEGDVMYSAAGLEVVPRGVGFAIRHARDGRVEDRVFSSADAAKSELLRRQPRQVA